LEVWPKTGRLAALGFHDRPETTSLVLMDYSGASYYGNPMGMAQAFLEA